MNKVKIRYFAGFMKSQEKWLNAMSDKGYRLVKTGKLTYEFEECSLGEYRYALDYVGDKSRNDIEDYKAFLESLGYRVMYKNLNLDYSLLKLELRPWADKGGVISTKGSTYDKELLIVEKENDGRDFELHTEKEDLIEYYERLSNPWYFLVFFMLVLAILYWPLIITTVVCGGLAVIFTLPIIRSRIMIRNIKKQLYTEE